MIKGEIKKARLEKGMTQEQLGKLCGIARERISEIENGVYSPNAETLYRLCTALGKKWVLVDD